MVLFHAAFVALKARCLLTVRINPDDYKLSGEVVKFKGYVYIYLFICCLLYFPSMYVYLGTDGWEIDKSSMTDSNILCL